jgi:nucleoside-diphosphate-sugar epimerase
MMNIAITGASGFVGKHLVDFYKEKAEELFLIQRKSGKEIKNNLTYLPVDFKSSSLVEIKDYLAKTDILFHTAYSPHLPVSLSANLLFFYQQCNPAGKFIFFSSLNTLIPELANDPYTIYKKREEDLLLRFKTVIPVLVVRPSFMISPQAFGSARPIISFARKTHIIPLLKPGPSHYFLPVPLFLPVLHEMVLNLEQHPRFEFLNIRGEQLVSLATLLSAWVAQTNINIYSVNIPTQLCRCLFSFFASVPVVERKLKMFHDITYSVPASVPQTCVKGNLFDFLPKSL